MLAQFQRVKQVLVTLRKWRIHENEAVPFARVISEKIVMHYPEALANQKCSEIRVYFYTVNIVQIMSAIAEAQTAAVASNGTFNQIAASCAWFEDGFYTLPVNCGQQLSGDFRRCREKLAIVFRERRSGRFMQ